MKSFIFTYFILTTAISFASSQSDTLKGLHLQQSLYEVKTGTEQVDYLVNEYVKQTQAFEKLFKLFSDDEFQQFKNNLSSRFEQPSPQYKSAHKALARLQKELHSFFKHAQSSRITKFLDELIHFSFTKEEKETLAFFSHLKQLSEENYSSGLESKVAYLLVETDYLKSIKHRLGTASFLTFKYEDDDLDYLISFYQLQKMEALFEKEPFDPLLYQHVETLGKILIKERIFHKNFQTLSDLAEGKIRVSSDLERLAKKRLKPFFKSLT